MEQLLEPYVCYHSVSRSKDQLMRGHGLTYQTELKDLHFHMQLLMLQVQIVFSLTHWLVEISFRIPQPTTGPQIRALQGAQDGFQQEQYLVV